MRRATFGRKESYDALVNIARKLFDDNLCAVVIFGSAVYMGGGRDVDALIVVDKDVDLREKIRLELEISKELRSMLGGTAIDVHVLSLRDFEDNLVPGSFLSGLALGYDILTDSCSVEDKILLFLEELSKERYVLHNRYGSWDLGFHATRLLKRRKNYCISEKSSA